MKIFVDGEEWERTLEDLEPGTIIIRPIKPEPKWQISEPRLFKASDKSVDRDSYVMSLGLEVSEDQAQLIKAKIERLMEEHFDE